MTIEDAIKFLQQLYPYGGHCWLDIQRTEAIRMAIQALQKEPVSDDFEEACNQMSKAAIISKCEAGKPFFSDGDYKLGFKDGAKWQKQKDNDAKGKKMMR